jgi:hypothetical protein
VFILLIAAALLSGCVGNPETVPPSFLGPTTGQFVNGTRWRVEVFVDADPQAFQSTPGIVLKLNPQETRQHSLDFAPHRVIAWAYVDTQFGTRTVGWYDRTLLVDPYATKWTLQFSEADFHSAAGLKETTAEEAKKKLDALAPAGLRHASHFSAGIEACCSRRPYRSSVQSRLDVREG